MNMRHFPTVVRVLCVAAPGLSLVLFGATVYAEPGASNGSKAVSAPQAAERAIGQAKGKPAPDPDDPPDAEQPDIGPPVPDDTADGQRRSHKDQKNHDKLIRGKVAPEHYATGPQQRITLVQSEKDKKNKKDKKINKAEAAGLAERMLPLLPY